MSDDAPERASADSRAKPWWPLQDHIKKGTLTSTESALVSRLIGVIGLLGETGNDAADATSWRHVRGVLADGLAESTGDGSE